MNIAKLREEPHWSYSAFQCFLSCPLKYQFRYIDQIEPERSSSCFPFGRAIHAALSERARIGKDMSVREVVDVFEDFFKVETEVVANLIYKQNESYDSLLETGIRMLEKACENWADDYAVQKVAEGFSVTVPGLSKPLIGVNTTYPDTEKLIRISKLFDCSLDYLLKDEIEQMDINLVEANEEARYIKLRAGVLTYLSFPPIFGWIVGIYSLKFQKENMKSKTQIGLTIVGILFSLTLTVIMIAGVAFGL